MTPDNGNDNLGLRIDNFFEEDKKKAEEYECVICKKIFSNNYNLVCNHCICEICINRYEKCPIDENDIIKNLNAFNESFIGKELLGELKVYCLFKKEGCNWKGIFDDFYSKHLKQCKFSFNNNYNNNIKDDFGKIIDDNNFENDNIILNKKRKISHEEIKENNEDIRHINFNLSKSSYSIFLRSNLNNNINLLPLEDENIKNENINVDNNNNDKGLILEKYFFENYNNVLIINSDLTKNIFPYHYYFTEPLDNSFNCQIEVISRDMKNNKEISFGLTNINNNTYIEVISTKTNIFFLLKGDIIKILYESNCFYIKNENGKFNKSISFENKMNIKYYPTIILNDKADILQVSHN